ncbi:MAG: HAD superfamily hydrolase (TIGR01490 family) [Myxococcota bacterium]|jgi:HAD superfamily hydrolase (TIGR01490 family)
MSIAFFDMDHTLVLCNTGRVYVEDMRARGEIGLAQLLRAGSILLGYKLAVVDMERLIEEAVRRLEGESEAEIQERCDGLFEAHIRKHVSPDGIRHVEEHRAAGRRVVLLTAQTPLMARPLCRMLGIEDYLCTRLETVDGRFTGALDGPACYGGGKTIWARAYAAQHGMKLEDCWFYTDSYSDLPMLQMVDNRRVVNPDPRLRLHARLRRWPVLRFER